MWFITYTLIFKNGEHHTTYLKKQLLDQLVCQTFFHKFIYFYRQCNKGVEPNVQYSFKHVRFW